MTLQHLRGRRLLLQRLGKLARARLHLVEQPHVLDRDHRLIGEGRDQLDLLLGEWMNRSTRQEKDADRHSLAQERNAKGGAIAPAFLSFKPGEFWIGQNVRNVNGSAFQNSSTGDRSAIDPIHRKCRHVLLIVGWKAIEGSKLEAAILNARDVSLVRVAKSRRRFNQCIEHFLEIEGRAADHLEHVGRGGLLLQRLGELRAPLRVRACSFELLFQIGGRFALTGNARLRLRSGRTKLATVRSALRAFARQGHPRSTSIGPGSPGRRPLKHNTAGPVGEAI